VSKYLVSAFALHSKRYKIITGEWNRCKYRNVAIRQLKLKLKTNLYSAIMSGDSEALNNLSVIYQ